MGLLNEAIALDPRSGEAYVERGYLNLHSRRRRSRCGHAAGTRARAEPGARLRRTGRGPFPERRPASRSTRDAGEGTQARSPGASASTCSRPSTWSGVPATTPRRIGTLQSVLERDPLFVPALVRLADIRWGGQGRHAEAVALGEQAVALDPGNETAWRHLVLSYISVGEIASAMAAFSKTADHPALRPMIGHLFRNEWREAGEAAYALDRGRADLFPGRAQVALAIRRHARVTGDYSRAIKALESWASVVWDGDEPILEGQLDMGIGVAGLADMLIQPTRQQRARVLAERAAGQCRPAGQPLWSRGAVAQCRPGTRLCPPRPAGRCDEDAAASGSARFPQSSPGASCSKTSPSSIG